MEVSGRGRSPADQPPDLFPPPGFSHVAVATGQRLVFVAGQTAITPDFAVIGEGDLAAQTRASTECVGIALRAGSALPQLMIEIEVTALVS